MLGCAQTGTGKTASFALPMIDKLAAGRARARMPRSLILEPTRELATQVEAAFEVYGKHHKLTTALLIGGESFADQERKLDRGVDVLIATPGRLLDLFERGKILLTDVRILVIDEADRMLDMGFIPDVERIVGLLPKTRQTLFFSATMPPEIRRLADAFLNRPGRDLGVAAGLAGRDRRRSRWSCVAAGRQARGAAPADRSRGRQERADLLQPQARRRHPAQVADRARLRRRGAARRHGAVRSAPRRWSGSRTARSGSSCAATSRRAVSTSRACRHVFNFDVPYHAEDYVHRIGRTGRAGRDGRSFTLAAPEDGKSVAAIVRS